MAAILTYIDNFILYAQISSYHFVSQPSDTIERNAKKILGFERFLSQIRDIEKNCLLIDLGCFSVGMFCCCC